MSSIRSFALGVGGIVVSLLLLTGAAQAASVVGGGVLPLDVVFDSGKALQVRAGIAGRGRERIRMEIFRRGNGRIVKGFSRTVRLPKRRVGRRLVRQVWAGRTWVGEVAPPGSYAVRVSWDRGKRSKILGRFEFRDHLPPVTGQTGSRGPVGEFGAGRNGGRVHEGFDILAPCGRKLVAARGGRIADVGHDPVLYGYYLRIRATAEPYSYFYSHLAEPSPVRHGQRIRTGQFVGRVGQTGNAATTPCHLHFQVERDGRPLDPVPFLRSWTR